MNRRILAAVALLVSLPIPSLAGPYAPAAGQPGSDAIHNQDPRIVEWASGYSDYVKGNPVNTPYANPQNALGAASTSASKVTSLGDGGQITLSFAEPIVASGNGPDFAVFGNSFDGHYLKLAYVEVSQDDVHWYLMPNDSLTPGPVPTYGDNMDPTNIFGLAGKYIVGYGTPFSLSEVGLTSASYVRIIDVVGNGTDLDSAGNPIYSPYPNDFGFNVAGVAVLSAVPEPGSMASMLIGVGILSIAWKKATDARRTRSDRPSTDRDIS